ncbi:MAG: PAS domain S-box protein [Gemmatimonadaceae bacterium]|nr:PAS domain S-box protein [Caulobacter sp.]
MNSLADLQNPGWREADRLAALASYAIMDTPAEGEFDDLIKVAAQICDVPMALISLVDDRRQWFKSAIGLDAAEIPREVAFCAHAIEQREVFVVEDATSDQRFANNPLVTGAPNLRFYAGAPLETPEGLPLGTLCVLDDQPRQLDDKQIFALKTLARQVMAQLELRKALAQKRLSDERHRQILESALDYGIITMDLQGWVTSWNAGAANILGWSEEEMCGRPCDDFFTPEDRAAHVPEREMGDALAHGRGSDERWHLRKDGSRFFASGEMMPLRGDADVAVGFLKILRDRTEYRLAQEALKISEASAEHDRQMLTRELEHRVKNTLSLVQAIVRQSLRTVTTPLEAQRTIEDRLVSLGRAHNILTSSNWAAAPISAIVEAATCVHDSAEGQIHAGGPDMLISARAAVGLSMALHELCTNAAKYGALSTATGYVDIVWSIMGEGTEAQFVLKWKEHGGPPVQAPTRRGFGSRLIETSISGAASVGNTTRFEPDGLAWVTTARLAAIQE